MSRRIRDVECLENGLAVLHESENGAVDVSQTESNWIEAPLRGSDRDQAIISFDIGKDVNSKDMLPPIISLSLILLANFLFNVSFYIIIPTATAYSKSLNGGELFSGLVIGGVTFTSTILLVPLSKVGVFCKRYKPTLDLAVVSLFIGNILYAVTNQANFLYLILIGRVLSGVGFCGWFFVKRYCTDGRFVGTQRRTMCSNLLVAAQTLGMVVGPILGGLLTKVNINMKIVNGNTLPGWIIATCWLIYWILVHLFFRESNITITEAPIVLEEETIQEHVKFTKNMQLLLVKGLMCYCAFITFFQLGAWESEIPLYTKQNFGWSEWYAGCFIGLVGLGSFCMIFPLSFFSKKVPDRITLAFGFILGALGILLHLISLKISVKTKISYGVSWFLVCWGFNLSSTITLSLLSKVLPCDLSVALWIQISNYIGRFLGALWGTAGSTVGNFAITGLEFGITFVGLVMIFSAWRQMSVCNG